MGAVIVNVWDIDKTLADTAHVWDNNVLQNKNDNCRTPEFAEALYAAKPFPWVRENKDLFQSIQPSPFIDGPRWIPPRFNIIVTGRLQEHRELTRTWFGIHTMGDVHGYVSVPWDDRCTTREESHKRYVAAKVNKITDITESLIRVMWAINGTLFLSIYEDDEKVLAGLAHLFSRQPASTSRCFYVQGWVVRDGAAPVTWYPDEVDDE